MWKKPQTYPGLQKWGVWGCHPEKMLWTTSFKTSQIWGAPFMENLQRFWANLGGNIIEEWGSGPPLPPWTLPWIQQGNLQTPFSAGMFVTLRGRLKFRPISYKMCSRCLMFDKLPSLACNTHIFYYNDKLRYILSLISSLRLFSSTLILTILHEIFPSGNGLHLI